MDKAQIENYSFLSQGHQCEMIMNNLGMKLLLDYRSYIHCWYLAIKSATEVDSCLFQENLIVNSIFIADNYYFTLDKKKVNTFVSSFYITFTCAFLVYLSMLKVYLLKWNYPTNVSDDPTATVTSVIYTSGEKKAKSAL